MYEDKAAAGDIENSNRLCFLCHIRLITRWGNRWSLTAHNLKQAIWLKYTMACVAK